MSLAALAALADAIEREGPALSRRATAEMYADDPFWSERFGARGRRFADEDAQHHVAYLLEALRQASERPLVEYARWLRTVLTTRGMCTRHLAENLERLARHVEASVLDAAPAAAYLREAAAGLAYPADPARAAERAAAAAADRATDVLVARLEDARLDALVRPALAHVASFAADAVAMKRADLLTVHLAWLDASLARRGPAPAEGSLAEAACDALEDELEADPAGAAALARLREARAAAATPG